MSTVEEIVNAVKSLAPEEQAELRRRLKVLADTQDNGGVNVEGESQPESRQAAIDLDQHRQKSARLEDLFGSVSLGHPTGADNETIDRDLAQEYAATHEDAE